MLLESFIRKNHRPLFLFFWLLINLSQAAGTELFDDEAYYWIYSRFPAWGYFDHPPMIAWLIKAGYSIFPTELGLRLFIVFMNVATVYLINLLIERKDDLLFYAIASSVAVAQIGGIIAVPDTPLLFFVALFFNVYKMFIEKMSIPNTIALAFSMALMLYSKYHGVLVILFTLISNPVLLKKSRAWMAVVISILLFSPHLYWQLTHGFPSVQFHLFERNAASYEWSFTIEYLAGQIALAGPLLGFLFLWGAFRYSPNSLTERALKFSLLGVYLIFLMSSLKGRVEANWTIPGFVGLIVLSHQYFIDRPTSRVWIFRTAIITLVLVFAVRVYMLLDLPPSDYIKKDEFHENLLATSLIKEKSDSLPLVVVNSYQRASKYAFYSKNVAFSLNSPLYRRNNFNYWPIEDSLIGKKVYVIGPKREFRGESLPLAFFRGQDGRQVDNYYSFSKIRFTNITEPWISEDKILLAAKMDVPGHYLPYFQQTPYDTCSVLLALYNEEGDFVDYLPTGLKLKNITKEKAIVNLGAQYQLIPGVYTAKLAISTCLTGIPSLNSTGFAVNLK